MRIFVKSRKEIENLKESNSDLLRNYNIISIIDPGKTPVFEDQENILTLYFHDTDPEGSKLWNSLPNRKYDEILFNFKHAQQIIAFVENAKNKLFIVHCTMGICRSGAIGEFICDIKGMNYEKFKRDNPQVKPNWWVKKILWNCYNKENE